MLGMDAEGLLPTEREILEVLERAGRPLGVEAIAAHLDTNRLTVEVVDEPWLLREGLIERTERGRELTERGRRTLRRARAAEAGARPCPFPGGDAMPDEGRAGARVSEAARA